MYQWLLFDADGTLFDYDRAEAEALKQSFAQLGYGFKPDFSQAYRQINAGLWADFERGEITQAKLKIERFRSLCESLGLAADPADLSQRYLRNLALGTYLVDGAEGVVKSLAGRYRLAIITNGLKDVQRPRFASSAIHDYFSVIIISEEVGSAKPDGQIFDVAFAHMGWPRKEEVLMIGDSLSSDIIGGINYGIDTCWFNPNRLAQPPDLDIRYQITDLDQLLPLLRSLAG